MDNAPLILVVDDDHDIRSLLIDYLDNNGCRTLGAADGTAMWRLLEQHQPDLLVLDLNLPGEDGLVLCRNLRAKSSLPIIMLTARTDPVDRILGLEMGADDYLAKPFEPRELLARIRSVLRRSQNNSAPVRDSNTIQHIHFANWTLDVQARHLLDTQGVLISLSGAEFRLLRIFLDHPNRVLSRDQLLNMTKGRDADPFDRSIDLQVSRLRQKLGDDAKSPQLIKTLRSEGYLLTAHVRVEEQS